MWYHHLAPVTCWVLYYEFVIPFEGSCAWVAEGPLHKCKVTWHQSSWWAHPPNVTWPWLFIAFLAISGPFYVGPTSANCAIVEPFGWILRITRMTASISLSLVLAFILFHCWILKGWKPFKLCSGDTCTGKEWPQMASSWPKFMAKGQGHPMFQSWQLGCPEHLSVSVCGLSAAPCL